MYNQDDIARRLLQSPLCEINPRAYVYDVPSYDAHRPGCFSKWLMSKYGWTFKEFIESSEPRTMIRYAIQRLSGYVLCDGLLPENTYIVYGKNRVSIYVILMIVSRAKQEQRYLRALDWRRFIRKPRIADLLNKHGWSVDDYSNSCKELRYIPHLIIIAGASLT